MGRSEGPMRPAMSTLRLPLPPLLLLLLMALCRRPAAAFTTPPPPPDGQLAQLSQLSEEELGQLTVQQVDVLLKELHVADGGSGMSEAVNTSERLRQCNESAQSEPLPSHCRVTWDEALCWPESPPDTLVLLPCFKEFRGLIYHSGKNNTASRYCHANGTWEEKANYSDCIHVVNQVVLPPDVVSQSEYTSIIYLTGYSLSLVTLSVATWIFAYCRDLRCLRNTIHANLFITYILTDSFWIINLSIELGMGQSTFTSCVISVLLHYCLVSRFFWMFVEGHYLYMLVVQTFSADKIRCRLYILVGWGVPLLVIVTWVLVKVRASGSGDNWRSQLDTLGLDEHGEYFSECRWLSDNNWDWIYMAPVLLVLSFNLIFLIRIMWVLITKLQSTNSAETQQYKKATKALLVLLPLLGGTYILLITSPTEHGWLAQVFGYLQPIFDSTQGLVVALIYCFFNSEVRASLKTHYQRWNLERSVTETSGNCHRSFPASRRRSSATEMTYMVAEQAGHGCSKVRRPSSHSQGGRDQPDTV